MKLKGFLGASVVVTAIAFAGKALGLFREMQIAAVFGTSSELDVFLLVSNVPIVIFYLVGNGITTSFLPVLRGCMEKHGRGSDVERSFIYGSMGILFFGGAVLYVFGQAFAEQIVGFLAPGFTGEEYDLAVRYLRFFLIILFTLGIEGVSSGVLQAYGKLFRSPVANLVYSFVMLIPLLVLGNLVDIEILAWMIVAAYVIRMLVCLSGLPGVNAKPHYARGEATSYFKELSRLAPPVVVSTFLADINYFVDKSFASLVGVGAISALNYAEKTTTLITSTLFSALGFVLFPKLVEVYHANHKKFLHIANLSIQVIVVCGIFCGALCVFDSENIVVVLFQSGAFGDESVKLTSIALSCFAMSLPATLLRDVLKRISFAMHYTKPALVGSLVNCVVNVILMLCFAQDYGIAAIALSTAAAIAFECAFLLVILKRREPVFSGKQLVLNLVCVSAAGMLCCWICTSFDVPFSGSARLGALVEFAVHAALFTACYAACLFPLSIIGKNKEIVRMIRK